MQTIVSRITTLLASAVGDEAASAMCRLGIVRKIAEGTSMGWKPTPWQLMLGDAVQVRGEMERGNL